MQYRIQNKQQKFCLDIQVNTVYQTHHEKTNSPATKTALVTCSPETECISLTLT